MINDKLALLLQSPPIAISETEAIRKGLKDITAKDAALPKILPEAKVHKITPTAHLYLTSDDMYVKHQYYNNLLFVNLKFGF